MKNILFTLASLFITCAYAKDINPPVWNSDKQLMCQGTKYSVCNLNHCEVSESKAIWLVDFESNQVKYQNIKYEEKILYKLHKKYDSGNLNAIFLEGRVMNFYQSGDGKSKIGEKYTATVVGTESLSSNNPITEEKSVRTYTMFMKCYVPNN
jgi:hypothetical protein